MARKVEKESQDVKLTTFDVVEIDGQYHYLRVFFSASEEFHVYNICDFTFCVEIMSNNSNFVKQFINQINSSSLYSVKEKVSLLKGS